ncbi:hypothetical protein HMPREF9373_1872 [Psychrobacter sp. 1501(2011)]|nr:hypothetical protein HMPREF9373_1872 [Psychrobacter sp. 1501(2011)]
MTRQTIAISLDIYNYLPSLICLAFFDGNVRLCYKVRLSK